jgi:hypothetical protein
VVEFSGFKPMHKHRVNRYGFIWLQVRTVFEIVMLTFLFVFKEETSESTHVFLTDCFIDCCTTSNSFSIVVGSVCPPIRFLLYETENNILNRSWHSRHFPGNVGFPASPCFTEMLHNSSVLISFNSLWHHITDTHHEGETEFKIKVRLVSLFSYLFGSTF